MLLARLALVLIITSVGPYFLYPTFAPLLARAAGDLIFAFSSVPYLDRISWGPNGFHVASSLLPLHGTMKMPTLAFALVFPLAFSLALPGFRTPAYWRRAAVVLLLAFGFCATYVAIGADVQVAKGFRKMGLELHAGWLYKTFLFAVRNLWDITVVLFPSFLCLILARPLLSKTSGSNKASPPATAWLERPSLFAAVLALFVMVHGVAAISASRIRDLPRKEQYRTLEARNPEPGRSLVSLAELYAKRGKFEAAYALFELAMEYPEAAAHAQMRLQKAKQRERSSKASP